MCCNIKLFPLLSSSLMNIVSLKHLMVVWFETCFIIIASWFCMCLFVANYVIWGKGVREGDIVLPIV